MYRKTNVLLIFAIIGLLAYGTACTRTEYICPAYQSAFYIGDPVDVNSFMPIGKDTSLYISLIKKGIEARANAAAIPLDSAALASGVTTTAVVDSTDDGTNGYTVDADSLDEPFEEIFISPVQQPKRTRASILGIMPEQFALFSPEDSMPIMDFSVRKNKVLLVERLHKKKKEKLMATVPMVTIFPYKDSLDTDTLFQTDKTTPVK